MKPELEKKIRELSKLYLRGATASLAVAVSELIEIANLPPSRREYWMARLDKDISESTCSHRNAVAGNLRDALASFEGDDEDVDGFMDACREALIESAARCGGGHLYIGVLHVPGHEGGERITVALSEGAMVTDMVDWLRDGDTSGHGVHRWTATTRAGLEQQLAANVGMQVEYVGWRFEEQYLAI